MRRQLRLSISCAATFLIALLGLPLANYFAPELMATRVAGFTLTWLILGVLFFPFVWIIGFLLIDPLNGLAGRKSLLVSAGRGRWTPAVVLSLAVLFCGFLWEMWNIQA